MTHAEALEVLAILSGCYAMGWCSGYVIHIFKVFMEKI